MAGNTADFFQFINEQNNRIAAREAEEEARKKAGVDEIQLQRDQERRAKWGQLRAREHPSKRPNRGRVIGGSHLGMLPGPD